VYRRLVSPERRFAVHLAAHVLAPSTLVHGRSDSPVGLLAWIVKCWTNWSDHHGDVETVFSRDDLLTHAMIFWVNNAIGTSMRYYANANRCPWTTSHNRRPAVEAPTGITFVGHENPPGVTTTEQRIHNWLSSDRAGRGRR
jgi:microsomal epoxide hydrolase